MSADQIYLVAAPARCVLPSGLIDAMGGRPALPESASDSRADIDQHVAFSDEPLTVYRCRRDGSWWVVVA